jgi:hypothetical protein
VFSRLRSRLSYANVTATLALGGASYAAVKLPKNSVGTPQIKKNAVTGAKVENSSLTRADVKNGSLSAKDFGGALPAGAAGPQGPQGIQGPRGDRGDPGLRTGVLPSGATLVGNYALAWPEGTLTGSARIDLSFGLRLASEPTAHVVPRGGPKPPECQGTVYLPEAG